ncbi:hypothetical protein IWX90DRAFT_140662 [Phyllosticta citrichinensis]|uniref:Zn(2)-C6 fungal-type domain-containing protein n=1 Tax=Phyllosticta citrichinensis TaxID=1130410 RepID=A0ABR1XYN0_9PEZI
MVCAPDLLRSAPLLLGVSPASSRFQLPDSSAPHDVSPAHRSTDHHLGTDSPSSRGSLSTAENVQLPSLRELVSPMLFSRRHSDQLPAPPARLSGLPGLHASPGERSINHQPQHLARDDHRAYVPASYPFPLFSAPASITHAPAPPPAPSHHQPFREPIYGPNRRTSVSSGASAPSEHTSSVDDHGEAPPTRVKRRIGEASRGAARAARCVGQQEIPGEGMCFVYEDGSYCRTMIDGEAVNPSWGVTKAGKPRKRLAQACLTCREKKIKCEPGVPKCAQCTRARRTCRGGVSAQIPSAESVKASLLETLLPEKQGSGHHHGFYSSPHHHTRHAANSSSTVMASSAEPSVNSEDVATETFEPPRKRRFRSSSTEARESMPSPAEMHSESSDALSPTLIPGMDIDPYEADPVFTEKLLDLFLDFVNSSSYALFPRGPFMKWVKSKRPKSQDDRMLLYSVMALGNVFSTDPDWRFIEKQLLDIVHEALQRRVGKFTLQMCQSRMFVGLVHFARGRHLDSWDWCGSFLRALSALKLNLEESITQHDEEPEYDFDEKLIEECRRRTFWSGFLVDRYNGFSGGTLFFVDAADTILRLPSTKKAYDAGLSLDTPLFEAGIVENDSLNWNNVSPMGYHVLISAIWGDVWIVTTRSARRTLNTSLDEYVEFYDKTKRRLDEWHSRLPSDLLYSESNLDKAFHNGSVGTLVGMHALYNATIMRLNRYLRHASLPSHIVLRNIQRANVAARQLLVSVMGPLTKHVRNARMGANNQFAFSTPFPGYAVLLATDIISAGGPACELPNTIKAVDKGLSIVEEIAQFWNSAKAQQKGVQTRIRLLVDTATGEGGRLKKLNGSECWRIEKPLDNVFAGKDDAVYGADDDTFFAALRAAEPKRQDIGMVLS